jgi:Family of unknown function (DUF6384)
MDASQAKAGRPLDDVMIAMDVVDTLRHDRRIVERELNDETRRAELIERLRNLYKSQGIEVPDTILEEGVKALEEKRFVYDPPARSFAVQLARLYVTRDIWGRWVLGLVTGVLLAWLGWYVVYERPRATEQAAIQRELKQELPARIDTLLAQIEKEAKNRLVIDQAQAMAGRARSAAGGGQLDEARASTSRLQAMLGELRRQFEIRIVNREGETTGLWRVPRVNPSQRNYYLVVEAIDSSGRAIPREILNEETSKRETVTKWAVRVPKTVFDKIQADKLDDGIIQKAVIGAKVAGEIQPSWMMEVAGGALTKW